MKRILALAVILLAACAAHARSSHISPDETAIRSVMNAQVEAWNHADVEGFMRGYENSPDTTFVGADVRKGFQPILERYKHSYGTAELMGKLTFTDIDVRLLPSSCGKEGIALVTGRYHLQRNAKGATTKNDGIFSLVWRKGPRGWKIILDHTS